MDVLNVAIKNFHALGNYLKTCPISETDDIIDSMEQEITTFKHIHPEIGTNMQYYRDLVETRKRLKVSSQNPQLMWK